MAVVTGNRRGRGLFMFVGFFASGVVGNLFDPARLDVFTGPWVQFLAVITAAVTGIVATIQNYQTVTKGDEL